MSQQTAISWCDSTFNPWIGCTKVSPGCANCYEETLMDKRYGRVAWGKGQPRQRTSAANWRQPLKWNNAPVFCNTCSQWIGPGDCNHGFEHYAKRRRRIFCGSLCDWLDDEVPIEWLADLLDLIHHTPNLDWLLMTKRPENFTAALHCIAFEQRSCEWEKRDAVIQVARSWYGGVNPLNVWLGISAEDQQRWDERVPVLLSIPAAKRFVSVEPMLGPINVLAGKGPGVPSWFQGHLNPASGLDWVIFGGMSGPNARPCNVEWIRSGVQQCREAGVAPFVKQLGAEPFNDRITAMDYQWLQNVRHPKGGDPAEWPEDLRVQEWPGGAR